ILVIFYTNMTTSDIYTLSLHDALPILRWNAGTSLWINQFITAADVGAGTFKTGTFTFPNTVIHSNLTIFSGTDPGDILPNIVGRSEEHTSELQSRENLVCRLLLEKKKQ